MKPYDWSVVEPDITEPPDTPRFPLATFALLVAMGAVVVVAWLLANRGGA